MVKLAARSGSEASLEWLLGLDAARAVLRASAAPAAVAAARGGHIGVLELLFDAGYADSMLGPEPLHDDAARAAGIPPRWGCTALHEAASCGHLLTAEWLLKHDASATCRDNAGCEPLHVAALHGQADIARALLQASAEVNTSHLRGASTPLAQAAFNGHLMVVAELLTARGAVDAPDALRMTALHQAVLRGHAAVAAALLRARAELSARDWLGRTPLHLAARSYDGEDRSAIPDMGFPSALDSNFAVVNTLLADGAIPDVKDDAGLTPCEHAVAKDHLRVANLIRNAATHGASTGIAGFAVVD